MTVGRRGLDCASRNRRQGAANNRTDGPSVVRMQCTRGHLQPDGSEREALASWDEKCFLLAEAMSTT